LTCSLQNLLYDNKKSSAHLSVKSSLMPALEEWEDGQDDSV